MPEFDISRAALDLVERTVLAQGLSTTITDEVAINVVVQVLTAASGNTDMRTAGLGRLGT